MGEIMFYSLIEFDGQNQYYSIHPLVQYWSASMIGQNQYIKQKCVLSIIGLSIFWSFKSDDYKYRQQLLQHIIKAMGVLKVGEISSLISSNIALVYQEQGKWKEAEALQVVVMEKKKHLLGEKHPDTLTSMGDLAATYLDQGQWKKAEALQVVVMEKSKHLLGEEHPDTLTS